MDERVERARSVCAQVVYGADPGLLVGAERDLDAVEADLALARGRIAHARFLGRRRDGQPAEDGVELAMFERASRLYEELGDVRGQGEALFWIACLHQVIRRDNDTAVPLLERSRELAASAGDTATQAEALRHLGIAEHQAGRLEQAQQLLEASSVLRRADGNLAGVAANLVGLAYVASAAGRSAQAHAILDDAQRLAEGHGAHNVTRDILQARSAL
jgi:tetratricopeptide (TPR) repeat protein